jgi:hypothetical protein
MDQYLGLVGLEQTPEEERPARLEALMDMGWEPLEGYAVPKSVVVVSRACADDEEATAAARLIRELMGDEWVPETTLLPDAAPALSHNPLVMNLMGTDTTLGGFPWSTGFVPAGVDNTDDPTVAVLHPDTSAVEPAKAPAAKPVPKPEPKAEPDKPASEDAAPDAELVEKGLAALAVPQPTWADITDAGARSARAEEVIAKLFEQRAAYADRVQWMLAPELELLERVADAEREPLAASLLKQRSGLAEHQLALDRQRAARAEQGVELLKQDVARREQAVELDKTRVALEEQRVELAKKGVALAGEAIEHMKKWLTLANWAIGFLIFSLLVATAGGVAVLLLVAYDELDDWAAAPLVFVLALFAISPAVLLLRERPLEGLDKWTPGGEAGGDTAPKTGTAADQQAGGEQKKVSSGAS